jgi:hypothetical protein
LRVFYFCTQGCGRIARPAFPAPSDFSGPDVDGKTSRNSCGEIAKLWLFEIRIRGAPAAVILRCALARLEG